MTTTFKPFTFSEYSLSNIRYPLLAVPLYLITIFTLQRLMKNRPPLSLRRFAAVHNIFLAALSAAMCLGTAFQLILRIRHQNFFSIICDRHRYAFTGKLAMWLYIFYISKYYELLDTFIIVLRKRPLNFLHVYHHCIVIPLFWMYMNTSMIIHWILVIANSFVHVLMYYYYAASTYGIKIQWKRFITIAQIVQFVIDLTATWPFPVLWYREGGCRGSMKAWVFGQAVGLSFTYLFARFYVRAYKRQIRADEKAKQL